MANRAITLVALCSLVLGGCATIRRTPFTGVQQAEAVIPGIPDARFWADTPRTAQRMASPFTGQRGEKTMLALSGGSDNGAYGAGLLNGWTRAGTRPEFSIVTGVSTGALIAPFAFLGPEEDLTLERLYTMISAKDIYRGRFALVIPGSPSAASTKPLARLIESAVTDKLIDRIAREHERGRRLFVGTANLDAQRMVIWNMGAIAASSSARRYVLFRQILLASSSIPAVFTPVMITARAADRDIKEMHVDGGTTTQILTLPDEALTGGAPAKGVRPLHIYMIVNSKLNSEFHLVTPKTIPIATQSFNLNLRSALSRSVDLSYLYAKAHGIDFNISYIEKEYPGEDRKLFDTAYMRGLYDYGQRVGSTEGFWKKHPPDEGE